MAEGHKKKVKDGAPEEALHNFNLDIHGREFVRQNYPEYEFALIDEDLEAEFEKYDVRANEQKKRSRRRGLIAVFSGVLALIMASGEPLFAGFPNWLHVALTWTAAIMGLVSVYFGATGILRGSSKHRWLLDRFSTEVLRQFQYQHLVMRLPQVVAARNNPEAQKKYLEQRKRALQRVIEEHIDQREHKLKTMLPYDGPAPEWLTKPVDDSGIDTLDADGKKIFLAYRNLRLKHQRDYANTKLVGDNRYAWITPRDQEHLLSTIGLVCIAMVAGLHVALSFIVTLGHSGAAHAAEAAAGGGHDAPSLVTWISVLILWAAIAGLGARALEEGLQPQREAERCENYFSSCVSAMERFDDSKNDRERFEAMRAFERLAADELRQFLRNHAHARFLI